MESKVVNGGRNQYEMIRFRTSRPSWLSMILPLLTVTVPDGIETAAGHSDLTFHSPSVETDREIAKSVGHAGAANRRIVRLVTETGTSPRGSPASDSTRPSKTLRSSGRRVRGVL